MNIIAIDYLIILFATIVLSNNDFVSALPNKNWESNELKVSKTDPMKWWQTGVIYQIYPRSFKDSNGDGIGDLKGIEEKAEYLKDLGVAAVWLSPIYKSPMADFGYDISDFRTIDEQFGTSEDFHSLKSKLRSLGVKLILDFVPNHSSDEHEWFQKSIKKINPYTNYYIWKHPKGWNGSKPIPPNNWISNFNGPAWEYNEERKQFYLHQFATKQPDLNYRCKELRDEMVNILHFWMDEGADGFRMDAVQFLEEDEDFKDEPAIANYVKRSGNSDLLEYDSLNHIYTADQQGTYYIVELFRNTVANHKNDSKSRIMITEAYTTIKSTMKYYGPSNGPNVNMPFNFQFITQLNSMSEAKDFEKTVHDWIDNIPAGRWSNWVSGNHDKPRTASKYGDALVDGINMLILLLPGTAITYNGEEIGMQDTEIRWDQTVDPQGLNAGPDHYAQFTRDPCRTPFQWDDTVSSGFSRNHDTWLPVNPNYWYLNLKSQKLAFKSHYHVYKRLVQLRSNAVTIQRGNYSTQSLHKYTFILIRKMEDQPTYAVIVNLGTDEVIIDLENIKDLPSEMNVHTSSINSEHNIGDKLTIFKMRQKSSLVLTTDTEIIPQSERIVTASANDINFSLAFLVLATIVTVII